MFTYKTERVGSFLYEQEKVMKIPKKVNVFRGLLSKEHIKTQIKNNISVAEV